MAGSPRRAADRCVHSRPIVSPALVGYLDVRRRQAINSLVQEVEEHEYVVGSPVEDPIVRSPGVGSKLVELAGNVARPRVGEDWSELRETLDVVVDCDLVVRTQPEDCVVDRLSTADVEPHAFVRELIQNALDATRCRLYEDLRSMGEPTPNDPTRVPEAGRSVLPIRVGLRWVEVENELSGLLESRQELSVEDRGIGMDEEIITRYLLQVGRSYYATPQFLRRYDFTPTSRFGVGFLSVFADSDHVLVDTYRPSSAAAAPISLLLTGPRQYILTERGDRNEAGTIIRVRLRSPMEPGELTSNISRWCKRVEFPIVVDDLGKVTTVEAEKPEDFLAEEVNVEGAFLRPGVPCGYERHSRRDLRLRRRGWPGGVLGQGPVGSW
jgi:hypothetical protein